MSNPTSAAAPEPTTSRGLTLLGPAGVVCDGDVCAPATPPAARPTT